MFLQVLLLCSGTLFLVFKIASRVFQPLRSPVRYLPGPPSPSIIFGHMKEMFGDDFASVQERWLREYGPVVRFTGVLNSNRVLTLDPRALHHVLTSPIYEKPADARKHLGRIIGPGVLVVEGAEHRKQRRVMGPAFAPGHISNMTDIFLDKAAQLRDIWMSQITESSDQVATKVDALSWLGKLTLDVIGMAGFGYDFDALRPKEQSNELRKAFSVMFKGRPGFKLLPFLQAWVPLFRLVPDEQTKTTARAQAVMKHIGRELLAEKKETARVEMNGERLNRKTMQDMDLLSRLVRANMAADLPENQRMSDEDVVAQVPTFMVAGHETTSTAVTWCLYALSIDPRVQSKLRDELLQIPTDTPSMDALMALPYLDAVCRETLRIHPPVPMAGRVAQKEDTIPFETTFLDVKGRTQDHIRVTKGDFVLLPIVAINRSKDMWGEDALEFKPERWESIPEAVSKIPGVWGNVFSFLGGSRACIGYRFSIVEIKAILFTLLRSFKFELAVPKEDIVKRSAIVTRPVLRGDVENKTQMPLTIRSLRG
ncbi:cytochrome P450 [Neolentinus lepideus HHB14362 ss-1]|uniref:Cytochrome P450 n=1 Tax=Neolentinus lepideus HHB14362 ss-1 TaxID=1314782 RepID=A0A165QUI8_9AGAM|nr:cytochrome P450 [Neolentinus lepideus HHB14362 ss-1]